MKKKLIKILVVVIIILIAVGVFFIIDSTKRNKLVCTRNNDDTGIKTDDQVVSYYYNGDLQKISKKMNVVVSSSMTKYIDDIKDSLTGQYKTMKNEKGFNESIKYNDNEIIYELVIDNTKTTSKVRDNTTFSYSNNIKTDKKYYENIGYSCEIN